MQWTKACICMLQLGWPSMRIPILVTMAWPERLPCSDEFTPRLDFVKMGNLTFRAPDDAKYPAMQLAYSAGRAAGTMTGVLSAANEQASLCNCHAFTCVIWFAALELSLPSDCFATFDMIRLCLCLW